MPVRVAVIPARGGSKRIPRKNVRRFAGRPMIHYAIDVARQAGVFDHILVSTDDDEVAAVAQDAGIAVPWRRPAALADDHAGTVPVVQHALEQARSAGFPPDQLCCIYPGVPLLEPDALRQALQMLDEGPADFVFPVLAFESPVQRALCLDADGRAAPLYPEHTRTRTQDLAPAYHDAGQFYWGTAAAWCSGRSPHAGGRALVLPRAQAVDIDTLDDWDRAEALFARRRLSR